MLTFVSIGVMGKGVLLMLRGVHTFKWGPSLVSLFGSLLVYELTPFGKQRVSIILHHNSMRLSNISIMLTILVRYSKCFSVCFLMGQARLNFCGMG